MPALINITGVSRSSNGVWRYSWSAVPGAAFYRVVLFGQELIQTTLTYYDHAYPSIGETDAPPVEVVVENNMALSELNLCYFTIQWYGLNCHHYSFQEYVAGEWVERETIDERGLWLYTMVSPLLADDTEYTFRLLAVSDGGQFSLPIQFQTKIVRPPTPVARSVSWNSGTSSIVVS